MVHFHTISKGGDLMSIPTFDSNFEAIHSETYAYKLLLHQLDAVFESSQDGLYLTDGKGYTLRVNHAYEKITGYHREEIVGKHMSWLEDQGMISKSVSLQVLKEKRTITRLQKIGKHKEIMVTSTPVFDEHGEITLVVSNARDFTYLKQMEKELEKARGLTETYLGEIAESRPAEAEQLMVNNLAMKKMIDQVHQIAPFPTTVLLRGESGVGKEVIASLFHQYSPRSKQPFIKINCSAIPETLLESELFGYEKGAFSGARTDGKPGLLELAHGGTVLFDEIGDLPLSFQVKLLRVIQERELRRVGGTKVVPIDIRILSATNRNLQDLVCKKQFREDLFYRLNVIDLYIPPLRDRKENIRSLIDYYFNKFTKDYRIEKRIHDDTYRFFTTYSWPGNIRELRNLIENLTVSTTSVDILPEHLPNYITLGTLPTNTETRETLNDPLDHPQQDFGLKERLENVEKKIILEALVEFKTIRKTASYLKIDHSTLVRKMSKLGIDR
jgi:PAS domain S-box-containing protein